MVRLGTDFAVVGRTVFDCCGGGRTEAGFVDVTFDVGSVDGCSLAIPAYDARENEILFR